MTTIAGAMVAALPGRGVNLKVGRDKAGDNAAYPFLTFTDPISSVAALRGSRVTMARTRRMQWDLWQLSDTEDFSLITKVTTALDNMSITGPFDDASAKATKVFRVRFLDMHRFFEEDTGIVHHTIDVLVTHPV